MSLKNPPEGPPLGTGHSPRRVELVRVELGAVPLRPRLLNERDAAAYIGRAPASLRNLRSADSKRIANGEQPQGPTWVKVGRQPMYPLDSWHGQPGLDEWLECNGELFGLGDPPGVRDRGAT